MATIEEILALELVADMSESASPRYEVVRDDDSGASTIGGYLAVLLKTLWEEGETFDSKRPFGNSDWQNVIRDTLDYIDLPEDAIFEVFKLLSRDKEPVELLAADINTFDPKGVTEAHELAGLLIEKGWHK